MNRIVNIFLVTIFIGGGSHITAQTGDYQFSRPLNQVRTTGWHKIEIEKPVLAKINDDFSDIRILKVRDGDTTEVPYLIHKQEDETTLEDLAFRVVNQSTNKDESFVTIRNEEEKVINRIELDISPRNYDVEATLEGSQNRIKWFTIKEGIRLVGIANDHVSFHFSTLNVKDVDYRFFRVKLSDPEVTVNQATIHHYSSTDGNYQDFPIEDWKAVNNTDQKVTEIEIILKERAPVNRVELSIGTSKDYYRPAQVQYLKQTVETENGDKEIWRDFADFTVNSIEPALVESTLRFTEKLKITIQNFDDLPLPIQAVRVSGPVYHLLADLEAESEYMMVYENPTARSPQYDLVYFQDKIPQDLVPAYLGDETELISEEEKESKAEGGSSIFADFGLWGLMLLAVLVLGFFTLKLMKKEGSEKE